MIDTGPDTFAVFQNSKGHVRLSDAIHYSGYRAIELHDVVGDGNFPENASTATSAIKSYAASACSGVSGRLIELRESLTLRCSADHGPNESGGL